MSARTKAAALRRLGGAERRAVAARHEVRRLKRRLAASGLADEEDYTGGFAFIVTYGRSGSTLLQGHLNALPGWQIHGENGDAVAMMVAATQALISARDATWFDGPGSSTPWYGIHEVSPDHLRRRVRELVLEQVLVPQPGTRVCGFKEVRWHSDDLVSLLRETGEVFPGARFIVNVRSPEATAGSGWWRDHPDAADTIRERAAQLVEAAHALGDAAFVVRYDDYAEDVEALRPLLAWLGEEFVAERHRAVAERRLMHLQDWPPRPS